MAQSNEHISSSWTAKELNLWYGVDSKEWLKFKSNKLENFQISWKKSPNIWKILKMTKIKNSFSAKYKLDGWNFSFKFQSEYPILLNLIWK
jgi:hypothetical protein